jgi:hypothetical protein
MIRFTQRRGRCYSGGPPTPYFTQILLSTCELISSQNGKDAASLGSVMTTSNSSTLSSPTRSRSEKQVKTTPIFGRSYKTIQSEVRIEQLKSEIEALKPQTVKRLI